MLSLKAVIIMMSGSFRDKPKLLFAGHHKATLKRLL